VCCYECAGLGGACFLCLSEREEDWEDDIYCGAFPSAEEAAKQDCQSNTSYKEILKWTPEASAPAGCSTAGLCDGTFGATDMQFDAAIERAMARENPLP
jgi:hypothetical protein